jgi:ribosomal protein S18 acetylase RimI-like enzyme
VIRRIDTEDWQALRDVRLRALADSPDAFLDKHDEVAKRPDEHWRERAGGSDSQATFVVERDGRFDGMVSTFVADDPGHAFLVAMWVAPELRGGSTARELVEQVLAWARRRGARRVLLTVEPDNLRAARLYEKCGFVEIDDPPPFPYTPDPGQRYLAYDL